MLFSRFLLLGSFASRMGYLFSGVVIVRFVYYRALLLFSRSLSRALLLRGRAP